MSLQDILVFVDESEQCLGLAIELAKRSDAHLIGLAVTSPVQVPEFSTFSMDFYPQDLIKHQWEAAQERGKRLRKDFEERTAGDGVSSEWRGVEPLTPAAVLEAVALHARYADVVMIGQPDPDHPEMGLASDFPGQVAVTSGRPVLAVPQAAHLQPIGRRVLVAWNASREATRAVHDALPLLRSAQEVRVLGLTDKGGGQAGESPDAGIIAHLTRHGVPAHAEQGVLENHRVGDAILSSAADFGADLLVMGIYGHARMREVILGGASRRILLGMTLPVLVAH
ncbi:MAG: universal stress protein [Nitrococcus sp.]|nr:universal stress protein [Nitrococcus sp.]